MNTQKLNPHHVVITTKTVKTLYSYKTKIASIHNNGSVELTKDWNYSKTVGRYRAQFLGESTRLTKDRLASGEYKLCK